MIDKWNGQVVKDNVTIKKTALENIGLKLFGAPVQVVKGYIKKLKLDVPWNKLLSKPCEILLDDVHIVLKSPASFDEEFVRRVIWKAKQGKFQELLEHVKVSEKEAISLIGPIRNRSLLEVMAVRMWRQ